MRVCLGKNFALIASRKNVDRRLFAHFPAGNVANVRFRLGYPLSRRMQIGRLSPRPDISASDNSWRGARLQDSGDNSTVAG